MNQLFYTPKIENGLALLEEEESRHLVSVLRKKPGDKLDITDGKGKFYTAELSECGKKQALARILTSIDETRERPFRIHIAMAPTKNMERFEWFLEKATELGVDEITPVLCKRSERETVRHDRMEKILVSAMKQSLRGTLPKLNALTPFRDVIKNTAETQRFIPWCGEEGLPHLKNCIQRDSDVIILIGPEGDFTPDEAALAMQNGFRGVSLGTTRLRTETAGIYALLAAAL
jgi:16S rRNA (uracil1498-N3)-methyltransferase